MPEAEVAYRVGSIEFTCKGEPEWVSEQVATFRATVQELSSIKPKVVSEDPPPAIDENGFVAPNSVTARRWMSQHGVTAEHLSAAFHQEGSAWTVIASSVPGSSNKAKTINCYLLEGIRSLLETDKPTCADAAGRALCESMGCYDSTNHAATMKSVGNKMIGSKASGYTLPAPGLKEAAQVVREIAN